MADIRGKLVSTMRDHFYRISVLGYENSNSEVIAVADLEQLIKEKQGLAQIEVLQMILDSAHDKEEASERRWSRGTFIKAIEETIDDIKQEIGIAELEGVQNEPNA